VAISSEKVVQGCLSVDFNELIILIACVTLVIRNLLVRSGNSILLVDVMC